MPEHQTSRRAFVAQGLAAGAALAAADASRPLLDRVLDDPEHPEVPNEEVARIIREIVGDRPFRRGRVELDMPLVAEDGRIVPVVIESDLPVDGARHVTAVHLIVDHNPDAHLAEFHLTPQMGPVAITTRIKMKRTTWVRCLAVTSDDEVWAAYAKVSVALNGCG